MPKQFQLLVVTCLGLFTSCIYFGRKPSYYPEPYAMQWAWKPVYSADPVDISYTDHAEPVKKAGKIYVRGQYIFQSETGKGIHIVDNSNPAEAKRIGFLNVPGSEEIEMKDAFLYTNHFYDLITIDISHILAPKVISRSKNAFYTSAGMGYHTWEMPPDTGYFQCPLYYPDSILTGWVKDSVYASCRKDQL